MITTEKQQNQISFIQQGPSHGAGQHLHVRIEEKKGRGEHEFMIYVATKWNPFT